MFNGTRESCICSGVRGSCRFSCMSNGGCGRPRQRRFQWSSKSPLTFPAPIPAANTIHDLAFSACCETASGLLALNGPSLKAGSSCHAFNDKLTLGSWRSACYGGYPHHAKRHLPMGVDFEAAGARHVGNYACQHHATQHLRGQRRHFCTALPLGRPGRWRLVSS